MTVGHVGRRGCPITQSIARFHRDWHACTLSIAKSRLQSAMRHHRERLLTTAKIRQLLGFATFTPPY